MLELLRILIYYPLINLLTFFTWLTPGHYAAVAIILLTLLVRFLLVIPSKHSAQTQRKMQQVQPLLEELKVEYGADRQGLAAAQMELYKKNDINPFANCLMALVQVPILITLYYAIRFGLAVDNPHIYSWMARPDIINTNFFGISLVSPDRTYILPGIAAILQYIQMRLTLPTAKPLPGAPPDATLATQRVTLYALPATTLIFAVNFPAGVALYWVVSTAFQVVQQRLVNRDKYKIVGVDAALKEADIEHPEHKSRSPRVLKEIAEQTTTDLKKGVQVTVRKKSS
jgi:YidC/Oxa1 family membrane protein insertase